MAGEDDGKSRSNMEKFRDFPKQIIFIVGNEFCERFTFYGIKTILILYFTTELLLDKSLATALYHTFNVICYVSPVFGGILADGYIGKYRTILYMSIIYAIGNIVLSLTAMPALGFPELAGPMVGLVIIGIATGGIKPNISAFGGDQFTSKNFYLRHSFFSMFYFAINAGALFSTFFTPMLRAHVSCFGNTTCYPLAFGVPSILMFTAIILFVVGTPFYLRKPPSGNVVGEFCRCIAYAIKTKWKTPKKGKTKKHWMDYAEGKFSMEKIKDFKGTLWVLLIFLPISIFWCLLDQQGSTWTLQAEQMNGKIGSMVFEPDQMQVLNPVFILLLIPFFDFIVYPLVTWCRIPNRPLQRMAAGLFIAGLSYVVAGLLQIYIDHNAQRFPTVGQSTFRVYNELPLECDVRISWRNLNNPDFLNKDIVLASGNESDENFVTSGFLNFTTTANNTACKITKNSFQYQLNSKSSYLIVLRSQKGKIEPMKYDVTTSRPKKGLSKIRFLNYLPNKNGTIYLVVTKGAKNETLKLTNTYQATQYILLHPKLAHKVSLIQEINGKNKTVLKPTTIKLVNGAVYTYLISKKSGEIKLTKITDIAGNKVSIFLQIPQYFLIESGEILVSITGLSFAYSQAPLSMKSVVMAGWFLCVGIGDTIVIIWALIEEAKRRSGAKPENPAMKFFMFSGIIFITTVLFIILAQFYTYVDDKMYTVHEFNGDGDKDEIGDNNEDENKATESTALLD